MNLAGMNPFNRMPQAKQEIDSNTTLVLTEAGRAAAQDEYSSSPMLVKLMEGNKPVRLIAQELGCDVRYVIEAAKQKEKDGLIKRVG